MTTPVAPFFFFDSDQECCVSMIDANGDYWSAVFDDASCYVDDLTFVPYLIGPIPR